MENNTLLSLEINMPSSSLCDIHPSHYFFSFHLLKLSTTSKMGYANKTSICINHPFEASNTQVTRTIKQPGNVYLSIGKSDISRKSGQTKSEPCLLYSCQTCRPIPAKKLIRRVLGSIPWKSLSLSIVVIKDVDSSLLALLFGFLGNSYIPLGLGFLLALPLVGGLTMASTRDC